MCSTWCRFCNIATTRWPRYGFRIWLWLLPWAGEDANKRGEL